MKSYFKILYGSIYIMFLNGKIVRLENRFPRAGDGGGEVGGPGEVSVVREQFCIQLAVAVPQIYTCVQVTWD